MATDAHVVLPCATQNELTGAQAAVLLRANPNVVAVAEGANMPSTPEAVAVLEAHAVLFGPAKAANAGGVAVSGLEMSQNAARLAWGREEVDARLQGIMRRIHESCRETIAAYGLPPNAYAAAANITGFVKVAEAMLAEGLV